MRGEKNRKDAGDCIPEDLAYGLVMTRMEYAKHTLYMKYCIGFRSATNCAILDTMYTESDGNLLTRHVY
jgi:hypothetical protein